MLFLRRIVSLDGLGLDDDTRVTPLVVLTLVGNRPRHVTGGKYEARRNSGEK